MMLVGNVSASLNTEMIEQFKTQYTEQGIQPVIVDRLREGMSVSKIVEYSLLIEGLNPQNTIFHLYCLGLPPADIRDAAKVNGIDEPILVAGYKKSVVECSDALTDSQAIVSGGFSGPSMGRSGTSGVHASPSTF